PCCSDPKSAARLLLWRLLAACEPSRRGGGLAGQGAGGEEAEGGGGAGGGGGAAAMMPVQRLICFCRYLRWFTFRLDFTGLSSASLMLLEAESMKLSRSLVASLKSPASPPRAAAAGKRRRRRSAPSGAGHGPPRLPARTAAHSPRPGTAEGREEQRPRGGCRAHGAGTRTSLGQVYTPLGTGTEPPAQVRTSRDGYIHPSDRYIYPSAQVHAAQDGYRAHGTGTHTPLTHVYTPLGHVLTPLGTGTEPPGQVHTSRDGYIHPWDRYIYPLAHPGMGTEPMGQVHIHPWDRYIHSLGQVHTHSRTGTEPLGQVHTSPGTGTHTPL
uniref:Uncharacterized protein n=1 Tax=Strigops habroptila TaxID=2489341 RepID=A0A672TY00_STRHB